MPASVRSTIGESETRTPSAESCARSGSSGATASSPSVPRRSTTLAAPPPVVVTTATRGVRARPGGLRPATSGAISISVSSMSTRDDPAVAEIGVDRPVGAGERAGVRARERLAERRSGPSLYATTGLPAACALRAAAASRAASRTVSRNSRITRVSRIVGEQLDQLADAEVGLVADRDQLGEAEAARRAAREHRAEHGAALRDDARRAGGQRVHLQHRVHGERERGPGCR